jgi:lipopolysaccharide biosynthesis regulator YciM
VARSTAKTQQANQAISAGQFEYAHQLLEKACEDDSLSSAALSLNGRLYLHHFRLTQDKDRDLLLRSEKCLQAAIERNSAAFKNFERLTDVYCSLAEISTQQEKTDWLNKAFDAASFTIERYPGCGRVHLKLAQIAEQLGKTNIAIEQYNEAVDIENKYRDQFRQMYPGRKKIVSRLGEEKYQFAIERVKELSEKFDI